MKVSSKLIISLILVVSISLSSVVYVFAATNTVLKWVIVTASSLNVRKGPGMSYSVVRTVSKNTVVPVLEVKGGWYRIGTSEWIYSSYTKAYTKRVIVTASGLNVRKGPSTSYSIVKVLTFNSIVVVYELKNGWYRIGTNQWISSGYTKSYTVKSNTKLSWWYVPNSTHSVPKAGTTINLSKYNACYVGNTSSKYIYLTFDLGYENGYTASILNTLKANSVKATFFVTKTYIDKNPTLVKRMANEGHIVGNHTNTHPSLPDIAKNTSKFNSEISSTASAYKAVTGKIMPKVLRPPYGEYSELVLYLIQQHGYKSVFWSFAYVDWDVSNQPDKTAAFNKIIGNTHKGEIMLLHGVSKTNAEILDSVIKNIKSKGYTLKLIGS